jgi:hypothetical protein
MQKSLSVMGVGLIGVGSIVVPTSATATTPECGTSNSSMTITFSSGICQAEFSEDGSSTFTVPNVASGLAAVLVGAGGGSSVTNDPLPNGYAGAGGEVHYLDLSGSATAGMELDVIVGAGGTSSEEPTDGGDTSVTVNSAVTLVEGGLAGPFFEFYCALNGSFSTYLGEAPGAGGDPVANGDGWCETTGPGITPSAGTEDLAGNAVPAVFANYSVELGKGGYLAEHTATLVQRPGQGASIKVNLTDLEVILPSPSGSDGLVLFRWYPTERDSLATTGQDPIHSATTSGLSIFMVTLGLALLSVSYRMRKRRA